MLLYAQILHERLAISCVRQSIGNFVTTGFIQHRPLAPSYHSRLSIISILEQTQFLSRLSVGLVVANYFQGIARTTKRVVCSSWEGVMYAVYVYMLDLVRIFEKLNHLIAGPQASGFLPDPQSAWRSNTFGQRRFVATGKRESRTWPHSKEYRHPSGRLPTCQGT